MIIRTRTIVNNYISNEVTLDYNAGFSGALAKMILLFGK